MLRGLLKTKLGGFFVIEKVIIQDDSQLAQDIKKQAIQMFRNSTNVVTKIEESKKVTLSVTCENGHPFHIERTSDLYESMTGKIFHACCAGGETTFEW